MTGSLALLLAGSIDDERCLVGSALPDLLGSYRGFADSPASWMVSRFGCLAREVDVLALLAARIEFKQTLPVAVLAGDAHEVDDWDQMLDRDARSMNRFDDETSDQAEISSYEIRPPIKLPLDRCITDLRGFSEIDIFVEIDDSRDLHDSLCALSECAWTQARARSTPDLAHTARVWSSVIHQCVSLDLSFKLSGVNSAASDARSIGIVNVFAAVALAISEDLSRREVESVLLDQDKASWRFTDSHLTFGSYRADRNALTQSRDLLSSVGVEDIESVVSGLQPWL